MTEWTKERRSRALAVFSSGDSCGEVEVLGRSLLNEIERLQRELEGNPASSNPAEVGLRTQVKLLARRIEQIQQEKAEAIRQAVEQERAFGDRLYSAMAYIAGNTGDCALQKVAKCAIEEAEAIRNRSQETAVCACGSKLAPNQVICLPCSLRNRSQEGR